MKYLILLLLICRSSELIAQTLPAPAPSLPLFPLVSGTADTDVNDRLVTEEDTEAFLTTAGETESAETLGMEIIEFTQANIFHLLPKAHKVFAVLYAPMPTFAYGPYRLDPALYDGQAGIEPDELRGRILALKEVIQSAKPEEEKNLVEKKIHLADLFAMRAGKSLEPADIKASAGAYADVYTDADKALYPYVALNMANMLILMGDTVAAMPIIKKVHKEFGAVKEFKMALNATLIEMYFIGSRFEKAWEMLADFVANKELTQESAEYRQRVGDVLFFLERYQEASDWYQSVLSPESVKSLSENVSWLYLAESVFQTGNRDVAVGIYRAMQPYFTGTVYGDVIAYRLDPSKETAETVMSRSQEKIIDEWLRLELLAGKFRERPESFTGESFDTYLTDPKLPAVFRRQLRALKAYAYAGQNLNFAAVKLYQKVHLSESNPVLHKLIDGVIVELLMRQGMSSKSENEATAFLRFLRQFEFRVRLAAPDRIFAMLRHNLELMGMHEATAEMTLHIIEKSVHRPRDKAWIYLKLAEAFSESGADRSALRALELVDEKLLDFSEKELRYRMQLGGLLRTKSYKEALALVNVWEQEGVSARHVYWIALKKTEINLALGKTDAALEVVEGAIGTGKVDFLPPEFDDYVNPLLAWQVILNGKLDKKYETLAVFYANQDRILKTGNGYQALLAALSAALAMNKKGDVAKLMNVARDSFDEETYNWLGQWTRGELWVNDITNYLDRREPVTE